MRTIDPSIMLAAMAVLVTPPPPTPARLMALARRVSYAPPTPPAVSASRAA